MDIIILNVAMHPGAGMQARRVIIQGHILQPRIRFPWHIISRALDIPVQQADSSKITLTSKKKKKI